MKPLYLYLLLINAAAFVLMLYDKHKAKKKLWRIPEATLMLTAVAGGSLGIVFGMCIARHKIRHPKFIIGVPLLLLLQCAAVAFCQLQTP
ncbi:MAG: DUF1294 domain-containing protein [Oscillospiraceae bacterium]|nr:DUF1294 domain-containing protein [Oscillospiraceae bacterium]